WKAGAEAEVSVTVHRSGAAPFESPTSMLRPFRACAIAVTTSWALAAIASGAPPPSPPRLPEPMSAAEILLSLERLNVLGRALYVAAHPDDENTALIAYWANGALYDPA